MLRDMRADPVTENSQSNANSLANASNASHVSLPPAALALTQHREDHRSPVAIGFEVYEEVCECRETWTPLAQ